MIAHDSPSLFEALPTIRATLALTSRVSRLSKGRGIRSEHKCPHFDGANCQLATRVVRILPAVVDRLPACVIRKECRWFSQEGEAACKRCPEITTVSYDLSR